MRTSSCSYATKRALRCLHHDRTPTYRPSTWRRGTPHPHIGVIYRPSLFPLEHSSPSALFSFRFLSPFFFARTALLPHYYRTITVLFGAHLVPPAIKSVALRSFVYFSLHIPHKKRAELPSCSFYFLASSPLRAHEYARGVLGCSIALSHDMSVSIV